MIETAEMLRNPTRWTFALIGPRYLTKPVVDSLLLALPSAPVRPIGPATELKTDLEKPGEVAQVARGFSGKQDAFAIARCLVNRGKSPSVMVLRCLDNYLCGVTPSRIREALERIAG